MDIFNSGKFSYDKVKHLYSKDLTYMVSGKPAIKGVESKIRVIFVFVCKKSDKGKETKDSFIN